MATLPKFLTRPVQGLAMAGNGLWNGDWEVPEEMISSWTENEEDLWGRNKPLARVNQERIEQSRQAFKTLGFDPDRASRDPDYNEKVFNQAVGKLKAAGVDVGDDADIFDIAAAYNKMSDAQKKTYAESDGSAKPREAAPAVVRQPAANGKSKASTATPATGATSGATSGATPIAPRKQPQQVPDQAVVETAGRYNKTSSSDTGVRVNGAPVETGDTATKSNIKEAQRASTAADKLQAQRTLQGLQADARSDERRNAQRHQANQDELDANLKARRDRLDAEREAARKERMDKRYKSRTLTGMADWENLGRDSTKRNFAARSTDETDESWNARSGAVNAVKELRKRFSTLGVKDADKNGFYAYNPNRMRDVSGLGNLFNKAVASGNLTDAQIEGINKTLDMYEDEGRKTKARIAERVALNDAENVRRYRTTYGLMDRNASGNYIISDDEVKKFHGDKQKAARVEILKGMQVAPGQGNAEGLGKRIKQFSDGWMKLMDNGLDVEGTLDRALSDQGTRKAYMDAKASVDLNDPEAADKLDQIRRRFVMNQAMSDAGLTDRMVKPAEGQTLGSTMASDLPGKSGLILSDLSVAEDNAPNAGVSQGDNDATKTSGAEAPVTDVLKPRKEDEGTQQTAKGGMVLRPRRRAS